MAENTKIAWTHSTYNHWRGCTKVSEGCSNCYAEVLSHRNPATLGEWGQGRPRVHCAASYAKEPLRWQREAAKRRAEYLNAAGDPLRLAYLHEKHGGNFRRRVFCSSLSDWLDDDGVPVEWFTELLGIIHATPDLDWLCLTKRPENWRGRMVAVCEAKPAVITPEWAAAANLAYEWAHGGSPANVWFGISGETEKRLWQRWGDAKLIEAPIHFLSLEPLLEDVSGTLATVIAEAKAIGIRLWVIVGGESGPDSRPFNVEWARRIVRLCKQSGVPVFVKQLGGNPVTDSLSTDEWPEGTNVEGSGSSSLARFKLHDQKGGDMAEWPEELRVRQFPADIYTLNSELSLLA